MANRNGNDDEQAVLAANRAFYAAFAAADAATMEQLWSARSAVACVHPGWSALLDREAVLDSWRAIFRSRAAPRVTAERPRAYVMGEVAFVVCVEKLAGPSGEAGTLVATNVFAREAGAWKLVHHQAGPLASDEDDDDDDDNTDDDDDDESPPPAGDRTLN